jgi:hypothetical protein
MAQQTKGWIKIQPTTLTTKYIPILDNSARPYWRSPPGSPPIIRADAAIPLSALQDGGVFNVPNPFRARAVSRKVI